MDETIYYEVLGALEGDEVMSDEIIAAFISGAITIIVVFLQKDKIFKHKNKKLEINQKAQNINQSVQIGIQNKYFGSNDTNKEEK